MLIFRTNRFDAPLKVAVLVALPALFCLWLGLGIAGSGFLGAFYGFFTPWVATFEAFRHDNESKKFLHCVVVNIKKLGLSPFNFPSYSEATLISSPGKKKM